MATIEFHEPPIPDSCEVCRYLEQHVDLDSRREHTLAMIAQAILIQDLEDSGTPLRMSSIHIESIGFPGPQHPLEPRHWLLALLDSPEIRLSLTEENLNDD